LLVRQRRLRSEDQGRDACHDALHPAGAGTRRREVHLLRPAGALPGHFWPRLLIERKAFTRRPSTALTLLLLRNTCTLRVSTRLRLNANLSSSSAFPVRSCAASWGLSK